MAYGAYCIVGKERKSAFVLVVLLTGVSHPDLLQACRVAILEEQVLSKRMFIVPALELDPKFSREVGARMIASK